MLSALWAISVPPYIPNTDTLLTHRKGRRMKVPPSVLCNLDAITDPKLFTIRHSERTKKWPERTLIGRSLLDETEYKCTFNTRLRVVIASAFWTRVCS